MSSNHSTIKDLPPELFEEIILHLDIPTINAVSLASPNFHTACFPYLFRSLSLNGDLRPAPKFLSVFQGREPVASLRKIELKWLKEDASAALLPRCTNVHTTKINGSPIGNTAILASMTTLGILELANLTFSSLKDYFELLSNLSSTIKQLRVRMNRFRESQLTWTGNPTIELSRLEKDSTADLAPFLRPDCPVSLVSLRAASLRHPDVKDLEEFLSQAPVLLDLSIETEHRPGTYALIFKLPSPDYASIVSLPLQRLKSLSIIDRTNELGVFSDFFTIPSESDDNLSLLESLSSSFSCNKWRMTQQIFSDAAVALSQQPRFRHLKTLHLRMMTPLSNSEILDSWVGRFKLKLERAGRSPRINITSEIVATFGHCLGYRFGSGMF